MPSELLGKLHGHTTRDKVADEFVTLRMQVGNAVFSEVGNPRVVQVAAKHLRCFHWPCARKQTLWLRVSHTIERQEDSLGCLPVACDLGVTGTIVPRGRSEVAEHLRGDVSNIRLPR